MTKIQPVYPQKFWSFFDRENKGTVNTKQACEALRSAGASSQFTEAIASFFITAYGSFYIDWGDNGFEYGRRISQEQFEEQIYDHISKRIGDLKNEGWTEEQAKSMLFGLERVNALFETFRPVGADSLNEQDIFEGILREYDVVPGTENPSLQDQMFKRFYKIGKQFGQTQELVACLTKVIIAIGDQNEDEQLTQKEMQDMAYEAV